MDGIINDAVRKATKAHAERLDKELLGAWRAGYNWLHVYDPLPTGPSKSSDFTLTTYMFPAYSKCPPRPSRVVYRHSYDLRDVTRDKIDEARRKTTDTDN